MNLGKTVVCYYGILSPFTYLGMPTLKAICQRHDLQLIHKPTNFFDVFKVSGGVPLEQRAPQRQMYRLLELQRWARFREMPINPEPKYFPVDMTPASLMVLAAIRLEREPGDLSFAYERATWVEQRDISDQDTITEIATAQGFDGETLFQLARSDEIKALYAANTQAAIALNMFGSPTYLFQDEMFWGQDRLELLEWTISRG